MRILAILFSLFAAFVVRSDEADFAQVVFSNGEKADGEFSLTPGKKLEIFDAGKKKRFSVAADEIVRVSVSVEEEKMEQGWMFREEGLKDKLKLPFKYPLRQLLTDVTLNSGATLHGHCNGVFYLEKDGDSKHYLLYANQKGEKEQTLNDLVYIKEIVFPKRSASAAKLGTLKAPPHTALFSFEREMTFEAPFTALVPGKYDAIVFPAKFPQPHGQTAYKIRYGLSGSKAADEEIKGIQAKIDLVEDFYTKKKIAAAAKEGHIVRALMELTRSEASYDAGLRFARFEIWTFEPTSTTWDIRKRLFLHREKFSDKEPLPAFDYVPDDKLKSLSENGVVEP
jgi:hypothetical protein